MQEQQLWIENGGVHQWAGIMKWLFFSSKRQSESAKRKILTCVWPDFWILSTFFESAERPMPRSSDVVWRDPPTDSTKENNTLTLQYFNSFSYLKRFIYIIMIHNIETEENSATMNSNDSTL